MAGAVLAFGPGQGGRRAAPRGTQRRRAGAGGHALPGQPVQGLGLGGPGHRVCQAAAADGGQQQVGRVAGQHEAGVARWLFQRLEQGVGGDRVHALGRVDQQRLAAPASAGALGKLDGLAHGVHPDVAAGLAFFVVDVGLRLLGQGPAAREHFGLGHQHHQVGVGMHIDGVAAGALAARALRRGCIRAAAGPSQGGERPLGGQRTTRSGERGGITQPCAHQAQGQIELAQARRPLQQPGVAALGQQRLQLARDPGGWGRAHTYPLVCTTACTACATAARGWSASMRAKRGASACARRA